MMATAGGRPARDDPARSATPASDANARTGVGSVSHSDPVLMSPEASCPHAASTNRMTATSSPTVAPMSTPVAVSSAATEPVSGVPNVTTLLISRPCRRRCRRCG